MPGSNKGLRAGAGSSFPGPLCPGYPWRIPHYLGKPYIRLCDLSRMPLAVAAWPRGTDPQIPTLQDQARDMLAQAQPRVGAVEALRALEGINPSPPTWAAEQDLPLTETPPD